jgi:hypothetical protein
MAAIIPADPNTPVMMRCVKLLYFEIEGFTEKSSIQR